MSVWIKNALGLSILAVLGLAVWGAFGISRHLIAALDAWGTAAPDLKPTLDAISGPRGTLHEVNKAVVKIGDAVVTTQLQERAIVPHTVAAVDSLATIAPHANAAVDSANKTLAAATETMQGATATLQTVNGKAGPLLDAYTASGNDLDAILRGNALNQTLVNVAGTTRNFDEITRDFARVTNKASNDYLAPKPWYAKVGRFAGDAFDYGAFVARHY